MNSSKTKLQTEVVIIGGGITGTGLARDLALRGIQCVVVEKGRLNAGASGSNQGLLHSGARYVSNDPETARECRSETDLLLRLAPESCENSGGLWVAVPGDDEGYIADFPGLCKQSGIEATPIDCAEARALEPGLAEDIIAAYKVDDASVDPFRLTFDNMSDARAHGASLLTHSQVIGMHRDSGRIRSVRVRHLKTGAEIEIEAEQIVNASGPWIGEVAQLAGITLPVIWSKGSILITQQRISDRVISRLRPAGSGDIIVPGGTVSLLGTTSIRATRIEHPHVGSDEVDFLVEETSKLIPEIRTSRLIRAFAGVRPLISYASVNDDRAISRASSIIDHTQDGIANLTTVLGGKLTTYRLTAEKTADLVCSRFGNKPPCSTGHIPLPAASINGWVSAGHAPTVWLHRKARFDALLCECEMVPESGITAVVEHLREIPERVDLDAIRLHTRMGKGTCQGAFCAVRTTGLLYDLGVFQEEQGIEDIKCFLQTRWKGLRPVLWGQQMVQEQLQEAIHCGLFNLENS
ncbi:MAG: anaerobic glycerol-3-phosphate dehydrogenase subunit A [Desulfobacteraceae bacterium]|nr:anaerobic glycerol-3-phosphate dehydrogenase subunit A [Desulfobacteraceae bacterium]